MNLTSLSVDVEMSSSPSYSPDAFFVRTDRDNYAVTVDAVVRPTQTYVNYVIDLSTTEYQEIEGAITFRGYVYGGATGTSASLRHDNLLLNGEVVSIDEQNRSTMIIISSL